MSAPLFHQDILFAQRLFAVAGFYHGALDGRWGAQTSAAEAVWDAFFLETAQALGTFDQRTEGNIATLLPKAQVMARKFLSAAQAMPFGVKILSGTRSYAEQDALFAKRPVVTKARGGSSNHNFGIAWDVGIFVNGHYYTGATKAEEQAYVDLAKAVLPQVPGIDWGGNWRTIMDRPHYELSTGKTVAQCRALLESGRAYV